MSKHTIRCGGAGSPSSRWSPTTASEKCARRPAARALEQLDLVAALRRDFVAPGLGRLRHLELQAGQELRIPPGQEQQQALDHAAVFGMLDPGARVTGAGAAADVVVEAGPVLALV